MSFCGILFIGDFMGLWMADDLLSWELFFAGKTNKFALLFCLHIIYTIVIFVYYI
jgi:hypothetical protein